jgi:protein O-GlcNAc transferase
MLSLFGLHNRDEFEIFCYSYGADDGSPYRARIRQDCDKFVDLRNLNHDSAARCIYDDQVDILVDLKGYTEGSRLEICALRPAPIQVRYLGLAGTTGADFFDYIITDRIITPEDHAPHYIENFAYLPHCYQVNDHTQAISKKDWKRVDFAIPEGSFVFCSFNQGYKIEPVMFDTWMKILRQVMEGVLWLQHINETAERHLRQEAEARGVKPERLIFTEKLPKEEHLGRLRLANLALDTRIVSGAATTSDALWAGVPVITLEGSNFASRMSSSILTAIGLPELIAQSLEEYEALAVRLARSPGELQMICQRLAKNRLTEPLFDTPQFTKNLEKAYKEMWKIFAAGERPRQIEVVEG